MCAVEGNGVFKGISILLKALIFFSLLKEEQKMSYVDEVIERVER